MSIIGAHILLYTPEQDALIDRPRSPLAIEVPPGA
jgi:hypothetical protein